MSLILEFSNKSYFDHVAWAVPNVEEAVKMFTDQTGIQPHMPPQENAPYLSAGALIDNDKGFEIIGPNPNFIGKSNVFSRVLEDLPHPKLMFWYVATNAFDNLKTQVKQAGLMTMREQHINPGFKEPMPEFRRAIIAPPLSRQLGIVFQKYILRHSIDAMLSLEYPMVLPNMIQYINREHARSEIMQDGLHLKNFEIFHPQKDVYQKDFDQLNIPIQLQYAHKPLLRLTLDTPNGEVTFE